MGTSLSSTRSVSSGTLGLSAMLGLAFSFGILEMVGGFVKVDCGTGRSYTVPRIKSRSRAPQPIHPSPASTIEPSNSAGELQYLG